VEDRGDLCDLIHRRDGRLYHTHYRLLAVSVIGQLAVTVDACARVTVYITDTNALAIIAGPLLAIVIDRGSHTVRQNDYIVTFWRHNILLLMHKTHVQARGNHFSTEGQGQKITCSV